VAKGGVFDFKANSEKFYPDSVLKRSLPLNYRMVLEAEGKGTFEQPDITLRANLSEGKFVGREVGGGKLDASLRGKELIYDARVFKDKMSLKGKALLQDDMPWSAEMEITKGRYDFLATAFLEEIPEDMMFNITGNDADATLTKITLAMFGQSFSNDDDIVFSIDDGKVLLPKFKLRSGTTSVNFQGSFRYNDFYDVMIDGTSSLAPLKAFSEKISLLRGKARFVLALQGDWEKPNINGGIDVTGGAFGLKGIPQRLASINGYSYFEDDTVVIERVKAKLGGGDIELSGVMKLDGLNTRAVNLDMLLKDVNLMMTQGFKANLGGNIIYRGDSDSKLITGEVSINRAEYKDRIEWRSWLLKVKRAEAAGVKKGLLDDIRLSVRLYGEDNVSIDNNVARAKLSIDTILRGTIGEPLLLGRVEATEGKVYFRNSEFNIVRATADFSDTAHKDPYVDIVAETTAKGYHVWLTLEGRLQQLDLTLVSDPELEDEEILSLLTVGEFGEKLRGLEGGIGAAEASSVLTGQFQNVVEERLRDLTGISRFTIDPYVSRRTGTITPRVTVSKRLGSDLFVTYSSSMSTSVEQEVKLEYVINRNISLLGGQDDLGTLGGDVRFKFFFK
jgi:translocation and assembly module TamB